MTSNYYQPSGQVPVRGVVVVVVFALAAVPMTVLYAWANLMTGFGLGVLIAAAMGMLLALLVRQAATYGKIRNPRWMGRAGAAFGLFLWYVQWSAWLAYANADASGLYLATHPWSLGEAILARSAGVSAVSAAFMALCWLAELGMFVLPCVVAGRRRAADPFCEAGGEWAQRVSVPVRFHPIADTDGARRRLEADPTQVLALLRPCGDEVPAFADIEMHRCPGGASFITLQNWTSATEGSKAHRDTAAMLALPADQVEVVYEADGPVVELLKLPAAVTHQLVRRWEAFARASAVDTDGIKEA